MGQAVIVCAVCGDVVATTAELCVRPDREPLRDWAEGYMK